MSPSDKLTFTTSSVSLPLMWKQPDKLWRLQQTHAPAPWRRRWQLSPPCFVCRNSLTNCGNLSSHMHQNHGGASWQMSPQLKKFFLHKQQVHLHHKACHKQTHEGGPPGRQDYMYRGLDERRGASPVPSLTQTSDEGQTTRPKRHGGLRAGRVTGLSLRAGGGGEGRPAHLLDLQVQDTHL